LTGLDPRFQALGANVFVIERYDRAADGVRIHQEDFAQVRGVPPEKKYGGASYEGLARLVGDLCGFQDEEEFLKRVIFMILSGNTDGHLKNFSLIYPDGRNARLSPAYDLVCVRQYLPENQLPQVFAKEREPSRIGWEHVRRIDRFLRERGHEIDVEDLARLFVTRCLDEWATLRKEADEAYRAVVDRHLRTVPLALDRPPRP
jgi:serine/threonine-protein kinase HipA